MVTISLEVQELLAIIEEQKKKIQELEEVAYIDVLTKLKNRRSFVNELENIKSKLDRRVLNNVCIAVFDIDNFKKINDNYGHEIGDQALFLTGELFSSKLRTVDQVYRYGGEEFVIIFENTDVNAVLTAIERCQNELKNVSLEKLDFLLTVSVGVKEYRTDDIRIQDVFNLMKQAKTNGKDCICH